MYTCQIIFRHGKEMCRSIGSTKRQAERNAAVMGLKWIDDHSDELYKEVKLKNKNKGEVRETAVKFTKFEDIDMMSSSGTIDPNQQVQCK